MIRGNVGVGVRMRCATLLPLLALALPPAAQAKSVRVAVVQLKSTETGDFAAMLREARSAKAAGAAMVVFPETADMGWLNPRTFSDAAPIPGSVTDSFADIAKRVGIWVATGLAERGRPLDGQPSTFEAYDSAVLMDPSGAIVLRHRQFSVVRNAFGSCPAGSGPGGCGYTPGRLGDTRVARTPFGTVGLLVCDDAFTFDTASLDALKPFRPTLVVVPWGVTAGSQRECGMDGFNATGFAAQAAAYLGTAYVVGANGTGERAYGRFLPSWYCGASGFATPTGAVGGVMDGTDETGLFDIPVPD